MKTTCIILSLAVVASAQTQYAITDLIGRGKGASLPMKATGPSQQGQAKSFPTPSSIMSPVTGPTADAGFSNAPVKVDPMAAILASPAKGPAFQSQGARPLAGQALSQDSMAVVSGLVEAFMHKVSLEPGERSCLEKNMGQLTGDVMGTVGDIITAVKALIAGKGTVQNSATGNVVSAGIDSAMKITSLVALSTQLFKTCVHGDALDLLNTTAHHMINGTYLEHEFLVNGVDIAHYLSDSITAFEKHDFHRFGSDVGTSLRKVLLSKNTKATRLPEGVPEKVIIQKASDGLMRGFFVSGTGVKITDAAHPDVNIAIDLHQCIAGNSAFFKELWMGAWDLIAQLSLNGQQHGFSGLFKPTTNGSQPKWQGEFMIAMMEFPTALAKCGVSQEMQSMFMEAVQSLNDVHVRFQFPVGQFHATDATDRMAKAVEAWTNWDFEGFGYQLGELLRELVLLAFPQKYSVDASGRLRRYSQAQAVAADKSGIASTSIAIIGGAVAALLVAFAAVRAHRSLHLPLADREALPSDIEDGHNRLVE